MVLITGKELPNVLHDLVQLLGPSSGHFTEAVEVFPVHTISLCRTDLLTGEPYLPVLPF
jgi:hypothetical protein